MSDIKELEEHDGIVELGEEEREPDGAAIILALNDEYKSDMMRRYPNVMDYIASEKSYDQILSGVLGRSSQVSATQAKFSLNLPTRKKVLIVIEYAPDGWEEFFDEHYDDLMRAVNAANDYINMGKNVYPHPSKIFRAFSFFEPAETRVIIIGQDPYHTKGAANGLSFSCDDGKQPSYKTIVKEVKRTEGREPLTSDLGFWAEQGVLMINMCLTVNEGAAGSHGTIWRSFVIGVLNQLLEQLPFVIICLWGREAQKIIDGKPGEKITYNSKKIKFLKSGHPSPLNTTNPFVGCNHFAEINEVFRERGEYEIDWTGEYVLQGR